MRRHRLQHTISLSSSPFESCVYLASLEMGRPIDTTGLMTVSARLYLRVLLRMTPSGGRPAGQ